MARLNLSNAKVMAVIITATHPSKAFVFSAPFDRFDATPTTDDLASGALHFLRTT